MIRIQFAIHEFHMFTYHLSQTWDKAHTEALNIRLLNSSTNNVYVK